MALNSQPLPFNLSALDVQVKFNEELGREITWYLIKPDLTQIHPDEFNIRFSPDQALTDEAHEDMIIEEDPQAYENLKKSWECNPQLEPLVGYYLTGDTKYRLIAGHRRFFSARESETAVLMWVAFDLAPEEVEHIRDWPEVNKTKVIHGNFFEFKRIYNDLKGRNDLDRAKRMKVWKKKGYKEEKVAEAERVFGRIVTFTGERGEKPEDRKSQVKAFKTYDKVCQTTFKELLDNGDMERVALLDQVAKAFLIHGVAHDDLKVTVDALAELSDSDPAIKTIKEDPTYLDDVGNLRKLDALARASRNAPESLVDAAREFTARLYGKLVDRAEVGEINGCLTEFEDTVARLKSALLTIQNGGSRELQN